MKPIVGVKDKSAHEVCMIGKNFAFLLILCLLGLLAASCSNPLNLSGGNKTGSAANLQSSAKAQVDSEDGDGESDDPENVTAAWLWKCGATIEGLMTSYACGIYNKKTDQKFSGPLSETEISLRAMDFGVIKPEGEGFKWLADDPKGHVFFKLANSSAIMLCTIEVKAAIAKNHVIPGHVVNPVDFSKLGMTPIATDIRASSPTASGTGLTCEKKCAAVGRSCISVGTDAAASNGLYHDRRRNWSSGFMGIGAGCHGGMQDEMRPATCATESGGECIEEASTNCNCGPNDQEVKVIKTTQQCLLNKPSQK